MNKKIIIVGGVAGGASTAARLRRLDESAEIIMVEKGEYIDTQFLQSAPVPFRVWVL